MANESELTVSRMRSPVGDLLLMKALANYDDTSLLTSAVSVFASSSRQQKLPPATQNFILPLVSTGL